METKACLYCEKIFVLEHGNSDYCPDTDCAYKAKLERQTNMYEIGDDAKKAIQKNYKIFVKLLEGQNSIETTLLPLLKLGFDADGYYGGCITKNSKQRVYRVHEYYFLITSDNPQKIKIWKISK